jgi:predicted nucleotidyltransferase
MVAAMNRNEAITALKSCADAIRSHGATSLFLFGSAARDGAGSKSDLDLFVDYDPSENFSLVDLVDIKLYLEGRLGVPVDITTRDSLHPMLRRGIENSTVRVF